MSSKKQKLFIEILSIVGSFTALGAGKYSLYSILPTLESAGLEGLFDLFFSIPIGISLIVGGILELMAISKIKNNPRGAISLFYLSLAFVIIPSLVVFIEIILPPYAISDIIYIAAFLILILSPVIAAKLTKDFIKESSNKTVSINKHFDYRKLAGRIGAMAEIMLFLSSFYFLSQNQDKGVGDGGLLLVIIVLLIALFGVIEIYPLKNTKKGAISFLISGSLLFLVTPANIIDIILLAVAAFLFIGAGLIGLQESLADRPSNGKNPIIPRAINKTY